MIENDFVDKFKKEKSMYAGLGEYVRDFLILKWTENKGSKSDFCIDPSFRVKDEKSLIQKAFYREKNYSDPYNDITDKVGIRFIFLTINRLKKFKKIIEEQNVFSFSCDRDFEDERRKNPTKFEYQSVHYILRPKNDIICRDIVLKKGISCEIQVRTILQHAYSELTHNTIYKPQKTSDPGIHRLIARSMALIETTEVLSKHKNRMKYNEKRGQNLYDDVATQTSPGGAPADENHTRNTGRSANTFADFLRYPAMFRRISHRRTSLFYRSAPSH